MTRRDAFLLFLAVAIMIGYTYALDTPQALQIPLRKAPYNFTTAQFNFIYFATFLLIGFMQVPLGILIDRFPIKKTLITLLLSLLISQIVIALMFDFMPTHYFVIILIMRSIFGLSGQGLYTVQCVIMSIFAESQYELLAGLSLALPFVFDAINSVTTTAVYDATLNLPLTWYIGAGVCLFSLLSGFWMNKSIIGKQNQDRNNAIGESKSCFKQVKLLNSKFWTVIFMIFFCEASLGPFNDNLNELIVSRFNFSYTDTGKLLLIPFVGLIFFTTFSGYLLRKRPSMRRVSMLVSTTLYMSSHFMLFFLDNTKQPHFYHYLVVIFFLFSMSFNFAVYYASITTSVPFLVDSGVLGTAWGCAGSAIGFSQCLIPLVFISVINSHTNLAEAYRNLNFLGIILSIIPVLFSLWINYKRQYQILDVHYADSENQISKVANSNESDCQETGLQKSLISTDTIEIQPENHKIQSK